MKKIIVSVLSLILAFAMVISLVACGQSSSSETTTIAETTAELESETEDNIDEDVTMIMSFADGTEEFELEEIPFYYYKESGDEKVTEDTIEVGFLGGEKSIPYLKIESIADIQNEFKDNDIFNLECDYFDDFCTLSRENDAYAVIDYEEKSVNFIDWDLFFASAGAVSGLDIVDIGKNEKLNSTLLSATKVNYVPGDPVIVSLDKYKIPIVKFEDSFYLPLQTLSDLFLAPCYANFYFNQNAVFYVRYSELQDSATGEYTELGKLYYDTEPMVKSVALTKFTYNEICLSCDNYYGLAKEHNIDSFDEYFIKTGLYDLLYSESPKRTYLGLYYLTYYYFSDSHSAATLMSPIADISETLEGVEDENSSIILSDAGSYSNNLMEYTTIRNTVRPDGIKGYEEVGNTAFITFDSFTFDVNIDYYTAELENTSDDVIILILYANKQIFRENSPIENVVLDLSCNSGGRIDAAACVIAWFLGDSLSRISLKNQIDGATGTTVYSFDANLNGVLGDPDDSLQSKNCYCITSPVSFSCGNLIPATFRNSQAVTLIGKTTGGGGCIVQPLSTADGSGLQISGSHVVSYSTNGSFYGADTGIDPNFDISNFEHVYDREYLTNFINNLP